MIGQNETICPLCERPSFVGTTHPRCKTPHAIDGLMSFFRYDEIIKTAIKALKYRFASDLALEFVDLIPASSFPRATLVPIPLHQSRLRYRGFNQAELLGTMIAERLHIPVRTDLLKRILNTAPQVKMKDRDKRLMNLKNAFSILHSSFSIPHSVLLFDDVFTTGATMRAAANALKRAGATFVWGITMAR